MNAQLERECVARLLTESGRAGFALDSPNPPAPDVRVVWTDGKTGFFEVTEVHPDEVPGHGSAARKKEEERAKRNPSEIPFAWTKPNAMPAIVHRVTEKIKKAANYAVAAHEQLSLLVVGSLPLNSGLTPTFVFERFLSVEELNRQLHKSLLQSRFDRAYVYLMVGSFISEWSRPGGWRILRQLPPDTAGWETIEKLKEAHAGGGLLAGTRIVARWP